MSGTLVHSPADIIRRLLIQKSLGAAPPSTSWPIYATNEPDSPDNVVTVYDTDGVGHGRTGPDRERQEHHGIQIRIRSTTPDGGYAKARAIAVACDSAISYDTVVIGAQTYQVQVVTRTGDVIPLGKEVAASKRSLFTINAIVALNLVA